MKNLFAVAFILLVLFSITPRANAVDMIYFDVWSNPYGPYTVTFDEATEATQPDVPFLEIWWPDMLLSIRINGQVITTTAFNLIDPDGTVSDTIRIVPDQDFPWSNDVILQRVVTNPDLSLPSVPENGSWIPFDYVWGDGSDAGVHLAIFSGPDVPTTSVPEPSSIFLLGAGLAGVVLLRRRFKN